MILLVGSVMALTDKTSGLDYGFDNTTIIINDKRNFEFYIRVDESDIKTNRYDNGGTMLTPENEYRIDWEKEVDGVAINQSIEFYKDKTPKISHYIDKKEVGGKFEYVYSFELFKDDEIEVNGSECDWKGKCKKYKKIDRPFVVNFNDEYDFVFEDLESGFVFTDIEFVNDSLNLVFKQKVNSKKLELDPTFSSSNIESISHCAINGSLMFMMGCDETTDNIIYSVIDTNGSVLRDNIILNSTNANCGSNHVAAVCLDDDNVGGCFVHDPTGVDDVVAFVMDWNDGTNVSINVIQDAGTVRSCDASVFNNTHFVIGDGIEMGATRYYTSHIVRYDGDLTEELTDNTVSSGGFIPYVVGVTTRGENYTVVYYDTINSDMYMKKFASNGTELIGETTVDANVYANCDLSVTTVDDTFIVGYYPDSTGDKGINVQYRNVSFDITKTIVIDKAVRALGSVANSVDVGKVNDSAWGITWSNIIYNARYYQIKDLDNNNITDKTTMATSISDNYVMTGFASEQQNGMGFCNDSFVYTWKTTTSSTSWEGRYINNTVWDGSCQEIPIPNYCNCSGGGDFNVNSSNMCNIDTNCSNDICTVYCDGSGYFYVMDSVKLMCSEFRIIKGSGGCHVKRNNIMMIK